MATIVALAECENRKPSKVQEKYGKTRRKFLLRFSVFKIDFVAHGGEMARNGRGGDSDHRTNLIIYLFNVIITAATATTTTAASVTDRTWMDDT